MKQVSKASIVAAAALQLLLALPARGELERVHYNNPGAVSFLGVGLWAWPMPMDWDGDGDMDLVVSCPDTPFNGTYLFENPGGSRTMPIFRPPVRLGPAVRNAQVCYIEGTPRVLTPGKEYLDFLGRGFDATRDLGADQPDVGEGRTRANQWKYVDFDGDGVLDLSCGIGYWGDYGWDNAFDASGTWTRGPLRGYVFILRNGGSNDAPAYDAARKVQAAGQDVDVYGMPSPSFSDFDRDGDLDLLCGEFLDGFTYFQNTGSRTEPVYAEGRRLAHEGKDLAMNVQMITPTSVDWDQDGDVDLICGDEDGRVALLENTGVIIDGVPHFLPPVYFQQEAEHVKFGALATPVSVDWDSDGDEDIITGNTAGHIGFIENLDGGNPPRWAAPVLLHADGKELRILAGPNGSIQGPCEAKWGYTTLDVADWDQDGLLDLVVNSIWGKVVWYRNIGEAGAPRLAASQPVEVAWAGAPPKPAWNWWSPAEKELATQWRTTPCVVDWNEDGLNDLVMLDHTGTLALFERRRQEGQLQLLPGRRVFASGSLDPADNRLRVGGPLVLNAGEAGRSGRKKLHIVDWDGDGRLDILVNSENAQLLRNIGTREGVDVFENAGNLDGRKLAGHTTSPTTVDWDGDGRRDLLIGAEDGFFYYLRNPNN